MPVLLANFASGQAEQPLKTVAQHEAYLKRIGRLPAWVDQAITNMSFDITPMKKAQFALADNERLLRAVTNNLPIMERFPALFRNQIAERT